MKKAQAAKQAQWQWWGRVGAEMDRKFGYIDHQQNDTVRPGGVGGGVEGGVDGDEDGGGDGGGGETGRSGDNKGGDKGGGDREGGDRAAPPARPPCNTRGSRSTTKMMIGTVARASGEKGRSVHIRSGEAYPFNAPEADLYNTVDRGLLFRRLTQQLGLAGLTGEKQPIKKLTPY